MKFDQLIIFKKVNDPSTNGFLRFSSRIDKSFFNGLSRIDVYKPVLRIYKWEEIAIESVTLKYAIFCLYKIIYYRMELEYSHEMWVKYYQKNTHSPSIVCIL